MNRLLKSSTWFSSVFFSLLGRSPIAIALVLVLSQCGFCDDEFQDLVNLIPRSANAVVLLNMEKAKNSPLGVKEGWNEKLATAFESGMIMVPPQATRFVLASQMDFEFKEPLWEAVVMDLDQDLSMEQLAQMRGGTPDAIEGLPALARPNDTYIVQLGPRRLAAMGPGNRQAVVRWIREIRKTSPPPLSPYLQKAAVYSDEAGSEIIMALDLEGVMSYERVAKYLKSQEKNLEKWQENVSPRTSLTQLAKMLSNIQGVRIGVRIGEQPSGKMAVDIDSDAAPLAPIAKPLIIQVLSDSGASINDFQSWTVQAKKNEFSLAGTLSKSGMRRLLNVIESPVGSDAIAAKGSESSVSPGELPALQAKKSREYFRMIVGMADDIKDDMKNAKNLASTSLFCEKYAKRIDRLPILNVDQELLDYSKFVADQLRQASMAVKTMGIQSGVREAQVPASGDYRPVVGGVVYGPYGGVYGYRYGANGRYAQMAEVKEIGTQRRAIRAEETATAATSTQQIRQAIVSATADIRRKMTQKYQVEF
ncbi:MAG: hypothetical protein IT426_07040 [Pirellulales bacterium]|nr:hypothetical protein [Pirellulales bacterium]